MDHNYSSSVLPSYLGISQHDQAARVSAKSQKKETTLINIRKRLRSAALTVAYERGLDSLTKIIDSYQVAKSPPTTAFGRSNKSFRNGYGYQLYERTTSAKSVASSVSGLSSWTATRDISPLRTPNAKLRKDRIFSSVSTKSSTSTKSKTSLSSYSSRPSSFSIKDADMLSLKSFSTQDSSPTRTPNSRVRKERIMSSVSTRSTTSTSSRPSSFSSREAETLQMFWTLNLHQIQELKERYSENSEFLVSMYENKLRRREAKLKKTKETHHNETPSVKSNEGSSQNKKREITLPDLPNKEEDSKSVKSTKSYSSNKTESSSSTLTPSKVQNAADDNGDSKNRKVGFNLKVRKKEVRLPPLPPQDQDNTKKRKPKSILKRQDSYLDSNSRTVSRSTTGSRTVTDTGQRSKEDITSLRLKLPKLSPVPPSATPRKQATSFRRATFNSNFKCSKEFEAAFKDIDNFKTKGSPLRPLSRSSSRNESVRTSSRSSSKIELIRPSSRSKTDQHAIISSRSSSKNESVYSDTATSTVTFFSNSKIRLTPLTPVEQPLLTETPTFSKDVLKILPRPSSKDTSETSDSRSNSTITLASIRKV